MDDKNSLYIPNGIKNRTELWSGFSKKELYKAFMLNIFLGIINIIIYLINRNMPFNIVFLMVSVAASVMIFSKDVTNISVADQVYYMVSFSKSQKVYYYIALDEWK